MLPAVRWWARQGNPAGREILHVPAHHGDDTQQAAVDVLNVNLAASGPAEAAGCAEVAAGGVQEIPEHWPGAHRLLPPSGP